MFDAPPSFVPPTGPSSATASPTACPPPPEELYFLPRGYAWQKTPAVVRQAAVDLILPAYRMLVTECTDPVEQSAGLTLVNLMWVEICQQHEIGDTVSRPSDPLALVKDTNALIARHLGLVAAKHQAAQLLFKSRMARQLLQRMGPSPSPLSVPLEALLGAAAAADAAEAERAKSESQGT